MKITIKDIANPKETTCAMKDCNNPYEYQITINAFMYDAKTKNCEKHTFGITEWNKIIEDMFTEYLKELGERIQEQENGDKD